MRVRGNQRWRATVVFVDAGMMLSFDQMASVLRDLGVRVVHLTRSENPLARLSSSLVYDETHYYANTEELVAALSSCADGDLVDVQCPEFLLDQVLQAADRLPAHVVGLLRTRREWSDKLVASDRMAAAGVPVPRTLTAAEHDVDELVAGLGLPLVLKQRVGSGGEGVLIAATRDEAVAALAAHDDLATVYAEEFVSGETLCWAAAFADHAPTEQVVYRTMHACRIEGPSSTIDVVAHPDAEQVGAQVTQLLDGVGLVNLDLVTDGDGGLRVVDVNLRAWHSVVALAATGRHFVERYLETLGLLPVGAASATTDGATSCGVVNVFPDQSQEALARSRWAGTVRFLSDMNGQRQVLPARYLAVQTVLYARRMMGTRPLLGEAAA